jgi:pimeloyl-ACP methyl ester carboxylesterase
VAHSWEESVPWIEANGISVHHRVDGDGPSVVLLHELGGSFHSWDQVAPGLAERYRVFRYDQRGFGLTEKVREPFGLETLVDDFQALVRLIGLPPPYHFVGTAAAATQMLLFLERDPAAVASLTFCNPAPGVDASRAEQLETVAAKSSSEGMRAIMPMMLDRSYKPELSDARTYEIYRGRYYANDPVCFALAFRVLARTDKRPTLGTITCPAMVVSGRQDAVRSVEMSEGVAKAIPKARFEVIDAGHFMSVTSPQALLALLLDFLPH